MEREKSFLHTKGESCSCAFRLPWQVAKQRNSVLISGEVLVASLARTAHLLQWNYPFLNFLILTHAFAFDP